MEKRRLELSSEQAAYWLIKTYIVKAYEISREENRFSKDEQEFSRIINSVSVVNWNIIFVKLSQCIGKISSKNPFNQCTLKDKHNVVDMLLQEIFDKLGIPGKIPNINLTERQSNYSILDMGIDASNVFVTSKNNRYRLPKYIKNYNYVLTSDDNELRFYNLILSIIVSVRRKNNRFNSLNMIKDVFCERVNVSDAAEVFDRVIEILIEYSIIKVESHGKEKVITIWPIDEGIIGEENFSDLIMRRYEEANDSRIKDYKPPSTRKERRMFTGKAKERRNNASSEVNSDTFVENDESIKLNGKNNKTMSIKVLKLCQQIERLPSDILNEIKFYIFENQITVSRKKANKKDSYNTYKAVFNIESFDFMITINNEENTCFFKLEENTITLINGKVSIIIDLSDNSVVTRFECECIDKHTVTLERKISKGPRVLEDIVIFDLKNKFASDKFRDRYYRGDKVIDSNIDKYIVHVIENTNLWTETSKTKERVVESIRNMKSDLELPALIERVDNCLLALCEKTDENNKRKSQYVKQ